jgi:hypothetical protein
MQQVAVTGSLFEVSLVYKTGAITAEGSERSEKLDG